MDSTSNPQGTQLPVDVKSANTQRVSVRLRPIPAVLFVIGFIILAVSSVLVHGHPRPYPFELQTTDTVQAMTFAPPINNAFIFISSINDPTPSLIALIVWLVGLIIIGVIVRIRGKSPVKWFESAAGIILTVGIASGINFLIDALVARPRPGTFGEHIHVFGAIPVHSFPSGHVDHDVAYYGFLLFLSLSPPVRAWRYRWILIPFQLFCVLDILTIGYSRILEGEHWLTDVLAGYLSGALWLLMCIFLYRWITAWIALKLEARQQAAAVPPGQA
jgi:membrane-associated phospholipid phosphatase